MDSNGSETTAYGLPLAAKAENIFFRTAWVQILLFSHRSVYPAERGHFTTCEVARSFPSSNEIKKCLKFYKQSCDEA